MCIYFSKSFQKFVYTLNVYVCVTDLDIDDAQVVHWCSQLGRQLVSIIVSPVWIAQQIEW